MTAPITIISVKTIEIKLFFIILTPTENNCINISVIITHQKIIVNNAHKSVFFQKIKITVDFHFNMCYNISNVNFEREDI